MRKPFLTFLTVVAISGLGAWADEEERVIAILQSVAPAPEKEAACLRLKLIGTAQSVPALKSLLADENLSQWALDALQTLPAREANDALLTALPTTAGKTKAGVVDALGRRREMRAVPDMVKLLSDADASVTLSAARALGKIGGNEAVAALQNARANPSAPLRRAILDAMFSCADRALADGDVRSAATIYGELRAAKEPPQVRAAAFRGVVLSSKQQQTELVVEALKASDEMEQAVAIQLVRELADRKATTAFADSLKDIGPTLQVALIDALNQRDDPAAAASVALATGSKEPMVRLTALKALGALGDATHVALLAERAAAGPIPERAEARSALTSLHRGDVLGAILAEIQKAEFPVRVELVQTLARRAERRAVPELLRLAAKGDGELSVVAIQALEKLADDGHAAALLALVVDAKNESDRAASVSAFVAVATRGKNPGSFTELALKAMPGAPIPARCALLDVMGQIGGPNVLAALRAALKDTNPEITGTALRVMAANAGDDARPDLLKLSREATTDDMKAVALRGYWRLVEVMSDRSPTERFAAVQEGLAAGKSPADLKLGLARLAELNSPEALELAQKYRRDATVRAEAESACLLIVSHFSAARIAAAEVALRQLAGEAESARVRSEAQAYVTKIEGQAGYVAPWLVSGPYRQEGKEAQQLFDLAFAPELPTARNVEWRPLPSTSSLTNWWFADLNQVVGGNHCVVYLKARVWCAKQQPVSLEIGTDDGVKLWINGALVHTNNAVRGFTPGEDKAKAVLKEGWNDFVVKITQHTRGCAAAIRVRNPDGTPIAGLRVEATE
jgi:HEAT repeat protein